MISSVLRLYKYFFVVNCLLLSMCIKLTSSDLTPEVRHSLIAKSQKLPIPEPIPTPVVAPGSNYKPCTINKDGHIYDLTSLSWKKYWFYSETAHNDSDLVFYISVCHPIEDIPSCSSKDGVCFAYINSSKDHDVNNIHFTSGGKIKESNFTPDVMQEGSLRYVYESGDTCRRGAIELPYKTELHLQCPFSADDETPSPILMASPRCLFIFVWMTLAACPKTIKPTDDPCIVQFDRSEYLLNLHSLHAKTFYKPVAIDFSFEINICGPIVNGTCKENNTAVCDVTDPQNPVALAGYNGQSLALQWQEDSLVMSCIGNKNSTIEIHFYCDRTGYTPRFYFSLKKSNIYTFTMYTVHVCTPNISDCVIEDKKMNVFDLRPLHKKEGNWEILGRRYQRNTVLYHINVCGPVHENVVNKCPAGPVGACQSSISSAGSKNFGYITSHPVVNKDGSLSILYTGGDSCEEGVLSSSTRINLICSDAEYPPSFIELTDSCELIIQWHTPAACPVNVVSGSDCKVTDPLFGHNFDLNLLRNSTNDYKTSSGDHEFLVNVCGPLVSDCEGRNDTAVCYLDEKKKQSGGIVPAELIFNDGTLIMKFPNGSAVCGDSHWSSQILFLCSHDVEGSEGLQYIHADESACIHHFIWHTIYACPPHLEINCSVSDGDLLYDLTRLSNPNINEIFITYDSKKKYVLNICRSVIHSKESRCAYNAGACLIDLSHENKTKNLGVVDSGPYIEDKHLKIKYENGDNCNATHNYQTIIDFDCTDEEYLSFPIIQAEEECALYFQWSSMYACPQNLTESAPTTEDVGEGNCTALNPQTKYLFDMNDLQNNTTHELHISDGTSLLISACGKINDSRCKDDSAGACIIHKSGVSGSAGIMNKHLHFHMWSTYLEYKDGETCSANGLKRFTKISFICREKGFPSGPVLIADDQKSCAFFVNWYTENACERHINCFAHSWEHMFDLSSLVRVWGNYEVKDPGNPNQTYLLNVCRPLNPVIGINCHPGSSVCLVRKHEEPLSLGHPILNPSVFGKDEVHLMYAHGSKCPENTGFSLSSRIIFICNRTAGAGTPTFYRSTHDCQTQFKWYTSLICPPLPTESGCQIAFEAAKANVDLSALKKSTPYKVSYRGHTFLINVCGASVCNGSGVCLESNGESYGLSAQSQLRWDYNNLLLTFYSGAPCKSSLTGTRTSEIFFECDSEAGFGVPEPSPLMHEISCMAVFYWRTNLTCIESFYNKPTPSAAITSSSILPTNTTTIAPSEHSSNVPASQGGTVIPSNDGSTGDAAGHTWVSVMVAAVVLISVIAASVFVIGRSSHGRRLFAHAKRTFSRKGYATAAESDNLLGGNTAFVYRVDEDEQVLRV